ncbi:hypothetical protein ACQUFG_17055, partial [Enterococcus gallinarum]|uniref:hypothetical protein n=1 Tax=Enterococcus gallinarum TaxID=1353 RepID=UPI003D0E9874
ITGNLGIGTTAPAQALHVVGNGAITGSLGIGTTTPALPLHVAGSGTIGGSLGIGNTNPQAPLHISSPDGLIVGTNSAEGGWAVRQL